MRIFIQTDRILLILWMNFCRYDLSGPSVWADFEPPRTRACARPGITSSLPMLLSPGLRERRRQSLLEQQCAATDAPVKAMASIIEVLDRRELVHALGETACTLIAEEIVAELFSKDRCEKPESPAGAPWLVLGDLLNGQIR
jgi:hypothetical protein